MGGLKWTFRNYPTDELRAAIALQYAVQRKHYLKFAVLSVDSDYGRGAIAFTKKYLPRYQATILSEDYYEETETDFRQCSVDIMQPTVSGHRTRPANGALRESHQISPCRLATHPVLFVPTWLRSPLGYKPRGPLASR